MANGGRTGYQTGGSVSLEEKEAVDASFGELAQKYGVVTLRGGQKGQGYLRTLELDHETKNWATSHVKYLGKYSRN